MKQRFYILIAVIAMATTTLDAQTDLKTETYTAYILNDVKRWENLTRRCEQQTDTTDIASLMSLIHCYYGYTMMLVEQKQHDAVERNIARAERYIAIVLAKEPNNAEAIDYSGVFTSYAVSLNRLKAPTLGKRSRRNYQDRKSVV